MIHRFRFLTYLLGLWLASATWLQAKSAFEITNEFVIPPAFKNVQPSRKRGIALLSQRLMLEWADPRGIQLTLGVDDSKTVTAADVTSQMPDIVERTKKILSDDTLESAQMIKVNGHDWIVQRFQGGEDAQKSLHVIAVGEVGGLMIEIGLFASQTGAANIGRYLRWILDDNSPEAVPSRTGQVAATAKPHDENEVLWDPAEAIRLAEAAAPNRVDGVFQMTVQATGRDKDGVYLNSELNYRDPRCLTIHFPPRVAEEYARRKGSDPAVMLKGKTIRVHGDAYRATILLFTDGIPNGEYYYQTHVMILDPRQIEVITRP